MFQGVEKGYIENKWVKDAEVIYNEDLTVKLDFDDNKKLYWRQIIHTILRAWKTMLVLYYGTSLSQKTSNLLFRKIK